MVPGGRIGLAAALGFAVVGSAAGAAATAGASSRLGPPVVYPYPGDAIMGQGILGDVNADGVIDAVAPALLLSDTSGVEPTGVAVAIGRGDGTLGAVRAHPSSENIMGSGGGGLYGAALADVDGDGRADAVSIGREGATVQRGRGDGTFDVGRTEHVIGFGVAALSADGDARTDLALAGGFPTTPTGDQVPQRGVVGVFLGANDAPFGAYTAYAPTESGDVGRAIEAADMNADGRNDLVVASSAGSGDGTQRPPLRLSVLLGRGDGTFTSAGSVVGPARSPAAGDPDIAIGDVDGNGGRDVLVADVGAEEGAGITLYRGDGAGGLGPAEALRQLDTPSTNQLAVGDVSGDRIPDLVAQQSPACQGGPAGRGCKTAFLFAEGRAGRGFAPWAVTPESGAPRGTDVADLNRDRLLDVLTYGADGFTVRLGGGLAPARVEGLYRGPSKTTTTRIGNARILITSPKECVPAGNRMRVRVKVSRRRTRGGSLRLRRVRYVDFIRNGRQVARDRKAPYSTVVSTDGLLQGGRHELTVRLTMYVTRPRARRTTLVRRVVRPTFTIC